MGRIYLYVRNEPDTLVSVSKVFAALGIDASLEPNAGRRPELCIAVIPWSAELVERLDLLIHKELPHSPFQLDCIPADGKNRAIFIRHILHKGDWRKTHAREEKPRGDNWPSSPSTTVFPKLEARH